MAFAEGATLQQLGDVLVLGLGKTGRDVALYLTSLVGRVSSVTLYGGLSAQAGPDVDALEAAGVRVVNGTEDVAGHYDLAIASPGISPKTAFFQAAAAHATEIIGEPEFAYRESPARWVAITGTNGKTTTTALTRELLVAGGLAAEAVGNIGTLITSTLADRAEGSWYVAELSSFQLETTRYLHPRVACLLNVTPDHLGWHGSMEAYAAAKEKVFQNMGSGDLAVVSCEDDWCRAIIERLEARGLRVAWLSTGEDPQAPCAAFVRDGALVVRLDGAERVVAQVAELPIKGTHNVQNALAASCMALEVGVSADDVRAGLLAFSPLEHRIEPCGELDGVAYVNDSKATNTDSVEKALTAFEPGHIVLMLGGHDKGTDLTSLAEAATSCCAAIVCFGDAGPRMAEAVRACAPEGLTVACAEHLADALDTAASLAHPGDVVLLSPACSSFDEFKSFEHRGRVFKQLVADRIARSVAR